MIKRKKKDNSSVPPLDTAKILSFTEFILENCVIKSHTGQNNSNNNDMITIIISKVLFNEFIIFCCAALMAVLGHMGHRLGIAER